MRLPELFCGFPRSPGGPPIAYPVALPAQAWSSGAAFMILQSCLGLRVDGQRARIHVAQPIAAGGNRHESFCAISSWENASADIIFQRVGERVSRFRAGKDSGAVPLFIHA